MTLPASFIARPFAHRALHDRSDGRPENSREAISAAIAAGYGIEIDLQLSSDDVPMVFHDYDLGRLTGASGAVAQRSAAELASIGLSGGPTGIPTLADILGQVAGRVPLLIEFKDQDGAMGPDVGRLERAAARLIAAYDGPVAVMSFNPHSVAVLAEELPDIPRGIVTESYSEVSTPTLPAPVRDTLRQIGDFDRVGASFISHEATDLDRPRLAELKQRGATILCWTVRSPEAEAEARKVAEQVTFEGYLA